MIFFAGCATTNGTDIPGTAKADAANSQSAAVTTPTLTIPTNTVYPIGPWTRERAITVNRKPMTERAEASAPNPQGQWTVHISNRENKPSAAWIDIQTLTLSNTREGGVQLHELTNYSRQSRAIFTPGLILCGPSITNIPHESKADIRNVSTTDESDTRTGTARATAVANQAPDGVTATLTITMELSPATISRTSTITWPDMTSPPSREVTQLLVKAGPFTITRETRIFEQPVAK
ncbi:hypothetical protein LBMAG48_04940 [Phycisphaerae bacterium]|nr:hypothetical protein LBMAG48_04940 [Phycisphaerae bacterium]